VAAEIEDAGGRAITLQMDVRDAGQCGCGVATVLAQLGGLHMLVNNAGTSNDTLIYGSEPDDWLDVMAVNFGGVVHCTQACLRHFMEQREGVIINLSSIMSERAWVGNAYYAASKAAINAFTRNSALELGRFGVRVNAILAGFVGTDLVATSGGAKLGDEMMRGAPLRDMVTPSDVAEAVSFLVGPSARMITGVLLTIDAGMAAVLGSGSPAKKWKE
jgi:3-oxoacyl-[acyl-carrier protein] reductase